MVAAQCVRMVVGDRVAADKESLVAVTRIEHDGFLFECGELEGEEVPLGFYALKIDGCPTMYLDPDVWIAVTQPSPLLELDLKTPQAQCLRELVQVTEACGLKPKNHWEELVTGCLRP